MNNKQESRFNMYLATVNFCDQDADGTAILPNFSMNLTSLKDVCQEIHLRVGEQAVGAKGVTMAKNDSREKVVMLAADTARKIMAMAKLNRNQVLLQEVNFAESDLRRMADTTLADTGSMIHGRAQDNIMWLVEFQITELTQQSFKAVIDELKSMLGTPRVEIVNQVQTTAKLAELFALGDGILADMDAVVEIIRLSLPTYYLGYQHARKVIETGTRKLAVKGLVTDAQSGEPVPGVIVSFWLNGNMSMAAATNQPADLVKKTALKGGFNIATLAPGTYRAKVQKAGYTEQTVTVYVNEGELTVVGVAMGKV